MNQPHKTHPHFESNRGRTELLEHGPHEATLEAYETPRLLSGKQEQLDTQNPPPPLFYTPHTRLNLES